MLVHLKQTKHDKKHKCQLIIGNDFLIEEFGAR